MTRSPAFCSVRPLRRWRRRFRVPIWGGRLVREFRAPALYAHLTTGFISHVRALSDRLNDVFDRLRRHGALSEDDVASAMREIRVALLEADVALPVVRDFVNSVREKAIGQEVLRSVTPGQMVVKIVHDHLVEVLGGGDAPAADGATAST